MNEQFYLEFTTPAVIEKDLRTLSGILLGISGDHIITDHEIQALHDWVNTCKFYENKQPYKEVISLIKLALEDGILTQEEIDDIVWYCDTYTKKIGYYDVITAGIQKMLGILNGIIMDKEINMSEIKYLDNWLEENDHLKNVWPYDELYHITTKIVVKGHITEQEHETILKFCEAVAGSQESQNSSLVDILKTGYYQIDPQVEVPGNYFCITGISQTYKRKEIAQQIELYGGYVSSSVSSKTNYLIVCDDKNACWAFSCYGRKIEQAINHRKNGANLVIVHEHDFYDELENYK